MKMNANKELYFNLMLFEGGAYNKLKEDSGLFTVIASYIAAKDEYNININELVNNNTTINENNVAILTKLFTNGNIDYIINSDINRKDIDNFLKTNLDYSDPWEDAYEFMNMYKGTEDEITYTEVMNTILNDSRLKEYNPDTYAKEILNNTRQIKSEANLEEMVCNDIASILEKYDPLTFARDRVDFKNICNFLIDLYIKTLLTLNTCLVSIQEDKGSHKRKHTSIVSVVLGYEDGEFDSDIISRLFEGNLVVDNVCKEVNMMSIFKAVEYFYTRVLDTLINNGNILTNLSYHANTIILSKENQERAMNTVDYIKAKYPVTLVTNNLKTRDIKTKKVERKKKPKQNHKKK